MEWWKLQHFGMFKEVSGGGIKNGEGRGKFSTGGIVEESELKMEVSDRIKVFCGENSVTGKVASLWK